MSRTDDNRDGLPEPFDPAQVEGTEGFLGPDMDLDEPPQEPGRSVVASVFGLVSFIVLIGAVVVGGFYLVKMYSDVLGSGVELKPKPKVPSMEARRRPRAVSGDYTVLDLYFPSGEKSFEGEQRSVPRASSVMDLATVVTGEFLSGPTGRLAGIIPGNVSLNGVYLGDDSVLYIDLSDEFRRNFQGNAVDEYILLKALHKSLMRNVYQIEGIKLLVDGKEVDSIGGHLSVRGLLGEAVSAPFRDADDE
ncbi:MAG: GerMN domain-containing protein [Thermodesulfovibrionales bacterium]|nr:GerMN domain-containing protein [Thermodesulfovibrionales bacterium]